MKKNLPLIIGIALPLIFIAIISAVVLLPNAFIKPEHNFVYTTEPANYNYGYSTGYKKTFKVVSDRVTVENVPLAANLQETNTIDTRTDMPPLYVYDVKTNTTHLISFDEAQRLILDPGPSSPDGYTVTYEYGHDGIFELFGSDSSNTGYMIKKDRGSKSLPGLTGYDRYNYNQSFRLLGWVK